MKNKEIISYLIWFIGVMVGMYTGIVKLPGILDIFSFLILSFLSLLLVKWLDKQRK